jgi:hypothetical protein
MKQEPDDFPWRKRRFRLAVSIEVEGIIQLNHIVAVIAA